MAYQAEGKLVNAALRPIYKKFSALPSKHTYVCHTAFTRSIDVFYERKGIA